MHGRASPEALGSPGGYVVPQGHRLLRPHPRLWPPPAGLFFFVQASLCPSTSSRRDDQSFPTFLRLPVLSCRLPYPGEPHGCTRLLLDREHWPSPSWYRLGIHSPTHVGSRVGGVTRLQSSIHSTARTIASPSPTRTFTPELSPARSPSSDVGYDYMGTQPTPMAGLTPARHAAPWAASRENREILLFGCQR